LCSMREKTSMHAIGWDALLVYARAQQRNGLKEYGRTKKMKDAFDQWLEEERKLKEKLQKGKKKITKREDATLLEKCFDQTPLSNLFKIRKKKE